MIPNKGRLGCWAFWHYIPTDWQTHTRFDLDHGTG